MKHLLTFLLLLLTTSSFSQFKLDGQFRPRTEYRHGYGDLLAGSADAGFAISSRIRLNSGYTSKTYQLYFSLQDVLLWGENRQLQPDDENNSFAVFEAWAHIDIGKGWSLKLGRQQISYDDERIFGGVDWTQQARNHDAGLLRYRRDEFTMDAGLAFNQDFDNPAGFRSVGTSYGTTGFFSYKTMQYLYLKQQWRRFACSLLFLNNGFQDISGDPGEESADGLSNLQTLGTHFEYGKSGFNAALNAYLQTGQRQGKTEVGRAFLMGVDLNFKVTDKIGFSIGTELISGDHAGTTGKTEAFFPLYGTNHKFNGFMDYFYVGNHANSIGLFDLHAGSGIHFGENSDLLIKVLNFSGQQELFSGKYALGTELDLVYTRAFEGFSLHIGYSRLFPSGGMYELKGISKDASSGSQNWGWAMLVFKPAFLDTSRPPE